MQIVSESLRWIINRFKQEQEYEEIISLLENALEDDFNAVMESMTRIREYIESLDNVVSRLDTYKKLPMNREIPEILSGLVDEFTSYLDSLYRFLNVLESIGGQEAFMNRLKNTPELSHIHDLIDILSQCKDDQGNFRLSRRLYVWIKMHKKQLLEELKDEHIRDTVKSMLISFRKLIRLMDELGKDKRLLKRLEKNWKHIINKDKLKNFEDALGRIQIDVNIKELDRNFASNVISPVTDVIKEVVSSFPDIYK